MTVAKTLEKYMSDQGIQYEVVIHPQTFSASKTAQASHISGDCIAKAVLLKGEEGYLLAVLPATHHLKLGEVLDSFNVRVEMATEEEAGQLFLDCELGAIPAAGAAYGLEVIVDEGLAKPQDIYFEGGDHTRLVHLKAGDFNRLMSGARRGTFSRHD